MQQSGVKSGLIAGILLATIMAAVTLFWPDSGSKIEGALGLCAPSPNQWDLPWPFAWLMNMGLSLAIVANGLLLNKKYTYVIGSGRVCATTFLVLTCASPWLTATPTASVIIAMVNMICIRLMCASTGRDNSTTEHFVGASLLSLGACIQYAFLLYAPIYLLASLAAKTLRWKEFFAFLLGMAAPWWILLGLGIVSPFEIRMPELTHIFSDTTDTADRLLFMISVGLTGFLFLLLALSNLSGLYPSNSRRRAINSGFAILGFGTLALMAIDFTNIIAYLSTFYLLTGVQAERHIMLRSPQHAGVLIGVVSSLYAMLFLISLIN